MRDVDIKPMTKEQLAAGGVDYESLALSLADRAIGTAATAGAYYARKPAVARILRALGDRYDLIVEVKER